jgi:hypothetical protein
LIYDTKHISVEIKKVKINFKFFFLWIGLIQYVILIIKHIKPVKDLYDNTVLEVLYNQLNREIPKKCSLFMPSIKHSPTSSIYGLKSCAHEAGYDAFMCGAGEKTLIYK